LTAAVTDQGELVNRPIASIEIVSPAGDIARRFPASG
jgi:hypothetical protein